MNEKVILVIKHIICFLKKVTEIFDLHKDK